MRFFVRKRKVYPITFPPSLWSAGDYGLQFNFKITGSVIVAAGLFSRINCKVKDKFRIKNSKGSETQRIEVKTSSSDFDDEQQLLFTQANHKNETVEQTLEKNLAKFQQEG